MSAGPVPEVAAAGAVGTVAVPRTTERTLFGHPRGLPVLFATEGFGAFAYYGFQSVLVLSLSRSLLLPDQRDRILGMRTLERWIGAGFGSGMTSEAQAAAITGLFGALAFAAPLLGGPVVDRLLGQTRAIVGGLCAICLGYVMLTVRPLFLVGMALLLCGMALSNTVKTQLGELYGADDPRRSNGFQIFSFSTLIAVVFAPAVCGSLGEERAWDWGYGAAAIGAALALAAYLAGYRSLHRRAAVPAPTAAMPAAGGTDPDHPTGRLRLSRRETLIVAGLVLLLPVMALGAVGNMEIFDGYLLWAQRHYDLRWNGYTMPVSWLLSVDAFISMGATAVSVACWSWMERRGRPVDDLWKIAIGTVLCLFAVLLLAAAPAGRVGLGWGLAFHALNDVGNTNTYMVSMALYSRLAPARIRVTVVNLCPVQLFLANLLVARLASRLDPLGPTRFWLVHAGLVGFAAAILVVLATVAGWRRRRELRRS